MPSTSDAHLASYKPALFADIQMVRSLLFSYAIVGVEVSENEKMKRRDKRSQESTALAEQQQPGTDSKRTHRGRFVALDGLRGVAVLLVLLAHGSEYYLSPDIFVSYGGWLGVIVFFVLSGFLITHLLLEERARTRRLRLLNFYARRALRIWPLYFAVLGAYAFILPLFDQSTFDSIYVSANDPDFESYRSSLLAYPFFLQNYLVDQSQMPLGLTVFWSLAVEEHFYLFWPLLLVMLRGRWLVPVLASIVTATFGLRLLTLLGVLTEYQDVDRMTHTVLDGLAAGCLVACLYHFWPKTLRALSRRRWPYLLGWALLLFLVWAWLRSMPLYPALPVPEYYRYTLASLGAAAIVACIVGREEASRPVLCSRPLTYLGKVSYGMYVLHPVVLGYVASLAVKLDLLHGAGYLLIMVVYLVTVIGVASVSFKFFESPILRLKARITRV
jgi:peptidoglycan/LPS O-acetylase OafA/YrhL